MNVYELVCSEVRTVRNNLKILKDVRLLLCHNVHTWIETEAQQAQDTEGKSSWEEGSRRHTNSHSSCPCWQRGRCSSWKQRQLAFVLAVHMPVSPAFRTAWMQKDGKHFPWTRRPMDGRVHTHYPLLESMGCALRHGITAGVMLPLS